MKTLIRQRPAPTLRGTRTSAWVRVKPFILAALLCQLHAGQPGWAAAAGPVLNAGGAPKVARGARIADLRLAAGFYAAPAAPFICAPGETVAHLTLPTLTAAQAQLQLDAARAKSPEAILSVTIAGTISISTTPLQFGSRTCVFFEPGSRIVALPACSAPALICLQDAELVSLSPVPNSGGISRGELDGAGSGAIGLQVLNSGKIHVDGLAIRHCGGGGLTVTGRGADRYADPVSFTRSTVTGCAGGGLSVRNSAQFIALDNVITGNAGDGMEVNSASAILANNICAGNRVGIVFSARDGTISRNQIIANATGLRLAAGSDSTLVSENTIQDNRLGAEILGAKATVESNTFANDRQLVTGGKDNLFQSNPGLTAAAVTAPGCAYFRPPTVSDPHADAVVWKGFDGVAMEREDLTLASGKDPMPDTEVTQRLMAARLAHPQKVLAVRLVGEFTITTKDGIRLPGHTCVLLDGRITNDQKEVVEQMVLMPGKGCGSFSGGSLVSRSKVSHGLSGKGGSSLLIERVAVDLGAINGRQGTHSVNGISTKQHGGAFVIRSCEISNPGSRGVWIHVTSRVYVLGNQFRTGGMTIDFDAFGNHSSALYNTLSGNTYHSTIFMEEGVKYDTAFANHCRENDATAIAIHCQEAGGPTAYNTVACNITEGNGRTNSGANLSFSGVSKEKNSADNYAFNNQLSRNHGRGAINIKANSTGNYIAQSVIVDCTQTVSNWSTRPATESFAGSTGFTTPSQVWPSSH